MYETKEQREKLVIAKAIGEWRAGRISRRTMMKALAGAGIGTIASRPYVGSGHVNAAKLQEAADAATQPAEVETWLKDVGGQFSGTTIKIVSEDTAPGKAIRGFMEKLFTGPTGITVNWEIVPLDQVLAKSAQDAATKAAQNDIYYFDQAWVGRFINDTVDPQEWLSTKPDLAMPNFNFDDFLPTLVQNICQYGGRTIGMPFDVPIFMHFYREDVFSELGLTPATTMQQYLDNAIAINEAKSGQGVYGTCGQMKSGHYALECDMTAYVWSHGGSVFTADGQCSLGDEAAVTGVNYLRELQKYMPAEVTTYDWGGQFTAVQQGQAGQVITWGEDFPGWDDPEKSKVSGMLQVAPLPTNVALRTPEQAGFEEKPELGHQGGSSFCLSAYSKQQEAAWIFLQWATSSNTQTLASVFGGGASPMRQSTFDDQRVKDAAKVQAGSTRHFPGMLEVINTRMGSEPHLPAWASVATDVIAVELGKLVTSDTDTATGMTDIAKKVQDAIA